MQLLTYYLEHRLSTFYPIYLPSTGYPSKLGLIYRLFAPFRVLPKVSRWHHNRYLCCILASLRFCFSISVNFFRRGHSSTAFLDQRLHVYTVYTLDCSHNISSKYIAWSVCLAPTLWAHMYYNAPKPSVSFSHLCIFLCLWLENIAYRC